MRWDRIYWMAPLVIGACGGGTPADAEPVCGNGTVEGTEACDNGSANSDLRPDACRTRCVRPSCGDRVQDTGEGCDTGDLRSDTVPNACRTRCAAASCGDGVRDSGEACDNGGANSDTTANACRTLCSSPGCGDGAIDTDEECDDGLANSDTRDACRPTCVLPVCGDGVIDTDEACDDAGANSDTAPDACRTTCVLPTCGDNVRDTGETCDPAVTCPAVGSCDDANACTSDVLAGSPDTCDVQCVNTATLACVNGDSCCPVACTTTTDSDCSGVNPASAVITTSACLTASTQAQAAVVVTLVDLGGQPITGATVQMNTTTGSLSAVSASGNTYWAVLTAPNVSGAATITITANSSVLATEPVITILPPRAGAGGAGGCPVDGNLRVRVVDEAGAPLDLAVVMVGLAEETSLYEATYGAGPSGPNTATTNAQGYAQWLDFAANLEGAQTVTAGAEGRQYATFYAIDAADLVIPLALTVPTALTGTFHGDAVNVSAPAGDPIEFAFVLSQINIIDLTGFRLADLLSDDDCYSPGGSLAPSDVSGSLYIPAQCAVQFGGCLQNLPEHEYTTAPLAFGPNRLVALEGSVPLAAITGGGGLSQSLLQLTLKQIGAQAITVASTGQVIQNIDTPTNLAANVACTISNAPVAADAFCLAAGDWESAGAGLAPGAGNLFLMGFKVGDTVNNPTLSITGVTSVAKTGAFAGIDYLGAAVAAYLSSTKAGIPPDTANGASAILNRSATTWTAGPMAFNNFFPIRIMTRAGRDFTLSSLPGDITHPTAHGVRHTFEQQVSEAYLPAPCTGTAPAACDACGCGCSNRTRSYSLWDVYTRGDRNSFSLPTLPPSWPRAAITGDRQGLVSATPESGTLTWTSLTAHQGLNAGFVYDAMDLADHRAFVTHTSTNKVNF